MNTARMTTQELHGARYRLCKRSNYGRTERAIRRRINDVWEEIQDLEEELSVLEDELETLKHRDDDAALFQLIEDELNRREAAQKYNLNIFEGWRTETEQ